jgi:hypothetical protein
MSFAPTRSKVTISPLEGRLYRDTEVFRYSRLMSVKWIPTFSSSSMGKPTRQKHAQMEVNLQHGKM